VRVGDRRPHRLQVAVGRGPPPLQVARLRLRHLVAAHGALALVHARDRRLCVRRDVLLHRLAVGMEGDAFLVPRPVRLLHGRGRPTDGRAAGLRQEVWLPAPSQAAGRPADGARPLRLLPHPRPRLLADLARPRRRFLLHQHDVHRRVGARGQDAPLLPVRDQGGRHPLLLRGDAAAGPRRGPFRRLHGPGAARPRGHAHAARDWDGAAVGGADPHPHAPPRVDEAVDSFHDE